MSISSILSTAVSGLLAGSERVATSAQNVVNVNTDGYLAQDIRENSAAAVTVGKPIGAGMVQIDGLEPSNVDIGKEFMDMIVAKSAYEANAAVVRSTEEMLNEAVDIKA